mgnify:FL=1
MTSTGDLKPCLCYEQRWALKPALRMENPEKRQEEIQNILRKSIENKPQMHCFEDTRQVTESHPMGRSGVELYLIRDSWYICFLWVSVVSELPILHLPTVS